jgi:hypothetical protein
MPMTGNHPLPASYPLGRFALLAAVAGALPLMQPTALGDVRGDATAHGSQPFQQADAANPDRANDALEAQRAVYGERLSRVLTQRARNLLQRDQVYLGMLESAATLMRLSTELAPESPQIWRIALDLATTMEDGDADAAAFASLALRKLASLDPANEVVRLRALLDVIDRRQTAEERIEAYQRLLASDALAVVGAPVASRVAFDLALLLRRTGDIDGFERELLRSIDLDPSFPDATELAAGYFRMRAPTPAIEAQALRLALMANPVRTPAALALASLCLEQGAYSVAADILGVGADVLDMPKPDPVLDGVLTDLAIALWGAERIDEAFDRFALRQQALDRMLLSEVDRQNMLLSIEERTSIQMPVAPSFATVYAALTNSIGRADADIALKNMQVSYETQMTSIKQREERAETSDEERARARVELAAVKLQAAWALLWLGEDAAQAERWIGEASSQAELSDDARARFDGMLAFRRGAFADARTLLEPIAARDVAAGIGLAMTLEAMGDTRGAARQHLTIARSAPATAMGVWARDRLWRILGTTPTVFDGAEEVTRAATLPAEFLELMRNGSRKLLLRVRPHATSVRPWDPLLFDIEIVNMSAWPLAISQEGPIADTITVSAAVNVPGRAPAIPPLSLVAIDRSLVIPPRASVVIPVDVSLTDASLPLRDDPLNGAFVSVHGILNWRTTERGLEAGPLGSEGESALVHVRGESVTAEWIAQKLAELAEPSRMPDPEVIAMLAHTHRKVVREPDEFEPEVQQALAGSGQLLADAVERMSQEARAWLIFAAPHAPVVDSSTASSAAGSAELEAKLALLKAPVPELEPMMRVLSEDEDYLPQLSWIAVRVLRPEDESLTKALASTDPRIARFAALQRSWLVDVQEERRRELNLR